MDYFVLYFVSLLALRLLSFFICCQNFDEWLFGHQMASCEFLLRFGLIFTRGLAIFVLRPLMLVVYTLNLCILCSICLSFIHARIWTTSYHPWLCCSTSRSLLSSSQFVSVEPLSAQLLFNRIVQKTVRIIEDLILGLIILYEYLNRSSFVFYTAIVTNLSRIGSFPWLNHTWIGQVWLRVFPSIHIRCRFSQKSMIWSTVVRIWWFNISIWLLWHLRMGFALGVYFSSVSTMVQLNWLSVLNDILNILWFPSSSNEGTVLVDRVVATWILLFRTHWRLDLLAWAVPQQFEIDVVSLIRLDLGLLDVDFFLSIFFFVWNHFLKILKCWKI